MPRCCVETRSPDGTVAVSVTVEDPDKQTAQEKATHATTAAWKAVKPDQGLPKLTTTTN